MTNTNLTTENISDENLTVYHYYSGNAFTIKNLLDGDDVVIMVYWNVRGIEIMNVLACIQEFAQEYVELPISWVMVHLNGLGDGNRYSVDEQNIYHSYFEIFSEMINVDHFIMRESDVNRMSWVTRNPFIYIATETEMIVLDTLYPERDMSMFLQGYKHATDTITKDYFCDSDTEDSDGSNDVPLLGCEEESHMFREGYNAALKSDEEEPEPESTPESEPIQIVNQRLENVREMLRRELQEREDLAVARFNQMKLDDD